MIFKDLDVNKLKNLISLQTYYISCIQCCKYYSVPTTAKCGHSLCHACWSGQIRCPLCGSLIDKKQLMLNLPLQNMKDHVCNLILAFEEKFEQNLDNILINHQNENKTDNPNKSVTAWLASSENHFSAPLTDSQFIIEGDQSGTILNAKNNIVNEKAQNLPRIIHAHPQDDWDKIEEVIDTQKNINKNQEDPVDQDFVYSSNNLRRSSRKTEASNEINTVSYGHLSENNSRKGSNLNIENKQNKLKKNWNTVTKMKKEFSKLNKQNNNKLNVSVEVSKKTQTAVEKNAVQVTEKSIKNDQPSKVCFFKKGALNKNHASDIYENVKISPKSDDSSNMISANSDVEITIKIGGTLANIYINKKDNDIQVKFDSDLEIQTSTDNKNKIDNKNPVVVTNENKDIVSKSVAIREKEQTMQQSISSKKNTASADTASVQNEITESIEKELANSYNLHSDHLPKILENIPAMDNIKTYGQHIKCQTQCTPKNLEAISKNMEVLNNTDNFNGNSNKEANIQLLESSKNISSAILMPTMKSNQLKSYNNKRLRDSTNSGHLPSSKKKKVEQSVPKDVIEPDSENINYDAVMSQVFASIDADMENLPKTTQTSQNSKINLTNNVNKFVNDKFSENIFSLSKNDHYSEILLTSNSKVGIENNKKSLIQKKEETMGEVNKLDKENSKPSSQCDDLMPYEIGTPVQDDDSDESIVEETPQKIQSFSKNKSKNEVAVDSNAQQSITKMFKKLNHIDGTENRQTDGIISLSDTIGELTKVSEDVTIVDRNKEPSLETPVTIKKFVDQIQHKSTPVARKSLNFQNKKDVEDDPQTLCPSPLVAANTTQEKEFLRNAFDRSMCSPLQIQNKKRVKKLCIAGSCLSTAEQKDLKILCSERCWIYMDKYTEDVTHLVVGVDETNRSQRSVKYICALAAAKWIVSYTWVEKCLITKDIVDEEPFEALDATGEPGPRRSRIAKQKLFQDITFYCKPPFSVLNVDYLKSILQSAGGRVVEDLNSVQVTEASPDPAMLLAESDNTEDNQFTYLAIEKSVIPVNYEWVINCLGSYTLISMYELILCPVDLVQKKISNWPPELISHDYE